MVSHLSLFLHHYNLFAACFGAHVPLCGHSVYMTMLVLNLSLCFNVAWFNAVTLEIFCIIHFFVEVVFSFFSLLFVPNIFFLLLPFCTALSLFWSAVFSLLLICVSMPECIQISFFLCFHVSAVTLELLSFFCLCCTFLSLYS